MKIGVLGSGRVGQQLGAALARAGHNVMLGTRTPDDLERDRGTNAVSLGEWQRGAGDNARVGTFAETAAHGDVVINATSGDASIAALRAAGAGNLAGKIVIDVANPLDFSKGMPPTLTICNDDSLGEQIQAEFPDAKVVKTLNTTNLSVMTDPARLGDGDHTLFVCGNDADAKAQVTRYVKEWFGWKDVMDLGDITTARGTEMYLPIYIRIMMSLGTPVFNIKVVR
jgi:predicted dinucleotide-binding enzyme